MICDILARRCRSRASAACCAPAPRPRASSTGSRRPSTEEFAKNGFVFLGAAGFGLDILFSRTPVRTLADLRRGRFWIRTTTTCCARR